MLVFASVFVVLLGIILAAFLEMDSSGDGGMSSMLVFAAIGGLLILSAVPIVHWFGDYRYRRMIGSRGGLGFHRAFAPPWWKRPRTLWTLGIGTMLLLIAFGLQFRTRTLPMSAKAPDSTTGVQSFARSPLVTPLPLAPSAPATVPTGDMNVPAQVEATIRKWARAWAARDVDTYLAAYSPAFVPADGMSRAQWESLRRKRLGSARDIDIEIGEIAIATTAPDRVDVRFEQHYTALGVSERSRKTMTMAREGGQWRIVAERTRPLAGKESLPR